MNIGRGQEAGVQAHAPDMERDRPDWRLSAQCRSVDHALFSEPSHTITGKGTATWMSERPAATVQGDPRLAGPGHRDRAGGQRQFDEDSIRVTVQEAAVLQSARPDYPFQGSRTKQFEQVGNMMPPLLAAAVLDHLLGIDGWQDVCRNWHRPNAEDGAA